MKQLAIFIIVFLFPFRFAGVSLALDSPVSATVLDQSFTGPILIDPVAGGTLNTARPIFSWSRPSPLPASPLNHYDFYLDDAIFAAAIPDSLTSSDFYFYSTTASGGTFTLTPKTNLTQGYHTWKVVAYSDVGISASSVTRTFYVDSISPYISITKVDQAILTWNTSVSGSIPDVTERYFILTTNSVIIKGGVEASANLQIVLQCPTGSVSCSDQTYVANIPTGTWEYTFTNLLSSITYTVKVSATDAANNSTLFPDFYVTYTTPGSTTPTATLTTTPAPTGSVTPTVAHTGTITPTSSASPSALVTFPPLSGTLTPPPGLLITITPAPYQYGPPPAPTPPPLKTPSTLIKPGELFNIFLLILLIFGLPVHLVMAIIGTGTPLAFIPKFLWILAYPFLRSKKFRTSPFSFITIYISNHLEHPWQTVVSDIHGYFNLKSPIPENIYLKLSVIGRTWRDNLFRGNIFFVSCLFSQPIRLPDARHRLLKTVYDLRIIPLVMACLTGSIALIFRPSIPVLIYVYFSFQYLFSEYLYPKISN